MTKRFPALILPLTLLLCLTVYAAEPRLVVHLPEGPIEAGENFTVTVDLTGNPGILNIDFTLSFDRERMECTDVKIGELLALQAGASAVNPSGKSGAVLAAASASLMEGDGPVGVFYFQAKEKLSDFHFSVDRITIGNQTQKKMDVVVTDGEPSGSGESDAPAPAGGGQSGTSTNSGSAPSSGNASGGGTTSNNGGTSGGGSGNTSHSGAPGAGRASDNGGSQSGNSTGGGSSSGTSTTGGSSSGSSTSSGNPSGTSTGGGTSTSTGSPSEAPAPDTESVSFTDIAGTWAESYIRTAAARNLFQGYPDGTFRPENRLTRAQFMMVLWNLAGRPTPSKAAPFTDMEGQIENFRNAVSWAYSKGYVNGTSAATFSPGEPLTRQAAVKILFAYNGAMPGAEIMVTNAYDDIFSDSGKISSWAREAMYWAVYQKIISGTSASTLEPGGPVTRAQLAAIMVRYVERFPS